MIPVYEPWLTSLEEDYAIEAVKSHWISSNGKYVKLCEDSLSSFLDVKYCSVVSTGTAACELALQSIGVQEGDEVIVPALTFISTADVVKRLRAIPIVVDVDEKTWNISIEAIRKAITKKTKAIFAVHLYGNMCDVGSILEICKENNLYFVEDACEALGSKYKGRFAGTLGDIGVFSHFGNKTLCAGEGGSIVTNNIKWKEMCDSLRCHGQRGDRYYHEFSGYNYRLNNVSAAILYGQIQRANIILQEKQRVYETYKTNLKNVTWQKEPYDSFNSHWLNTVLVDDRDLVMKKLTENGIDSRKIFYPICDMPTYKEQKNAPIARLIHERGVSLPSYPTLTNEQISLVCDIVNGAS